MILIKKAIRSMLSNKRAYIACIVLLTIGIIIYCSMGISIDTLEVRKDEYYKEYELADGFGELTAIPKAALHSVEKIEGIKEVKGRIVTEARVLMENNNKIMTLRLISYDKNNLSRLNSFSIKGGSFKETNDIAIGDSFLTAHDLKISDHIKVLMNHKEVNLNIVATAESPEYVYIIRGVEDFIPDPETFNIAFVEEETLSGILGMEGIYNNIVFSLEEGYRFDDVKIELEDVLKPYGIISVYPVEDQSSYAMLDQEIKSNKSMTTQIPMIFVAMAVIILYLMLKRIIEQDRMQIGMMRAFGYSKLKVLMHYVFYGGLTGLAAGILGVWLGVLLSGTFIEMYNEFFKLPEGGDLKSINYIIGGMLIALAAGVFGALLGSVKILNLSPADAMRPEAPKNQKGDILKILPFLRHILNSKGNMAVRNISRSKVRSLFLIIGIMFSFSLIAFMSSYGGMIDSMLFSQFEKAQIYGGKINFKSPVYAEEAENTVKNIENIIYSEAIAEIPIEINYKHLKTGSSLTGLKNDAALYKIYDTEFKRYYKLDYNSLIMTNAIAEKLECKIGDKIKIKSPYFKEDLELVVTEIITQNLGASVFIDFRYLSDLMGTKPMATAVIFTSDNMENVKQQIIDGSNIKSVEDTGQVLTNYKNLLASYDGMMVVMEFMAIIVAFAIIYNTSTVSLSERKREYATLRVMGMQIKEVAQIMNIEHWILCIMGMVLGIPFTRLLKIAVKEMVDVDLFTFPVSTEMTAYIGGAAGCILAVIIANKTSEKYIKKFDMVEVLKERE